MFPAAILDHFLLISFLSSFSHCTPGDQELACYLDRFSLVSHTVPQVTGELDWLTEHWPKAPGFYFLRNLSSLDCILPSVSSQHSAVSLLLGPHTLSGKAAFPCMPRTVTDSTRQVLSKHLLSEQMKTPKPGMVAHICHPSANEAEAKRIMLAIQ